MDSYFSLFTRDVSQAFIQSKTFLIRPIFVRGQKKLELSEDVILPVDSPLYNLPEAFLHWFLTYHRHHVKSLGMKPAVFDMCFLYIKHSRTVSPRSSNCAKGLTCMQIDDTTEAGKEAFIA